MPGKPLDARERKWLLNCARRAIEREFDRSAPALAVPESPGLRRRGGAFVTLKHGGRLRGCIGSIEGSRPLADLIPDMARAAAFQDPRFTPLAEPELSAVQIEISVLSPLRAASGPDDIDVGRHGLVVENGPNRGLLLPQVAGEYGWNALTFLEHTCEKASLEADEWKDEHTRIFTFTAEVFSETTGPGPADGGGD